MTAPDFNPVPLARKVLGARESLGTLKGSHWVHACDEYADLTRDAAPRLAHAVIDLDAERDALIASLAARDARMEALAESYERSARGFMREGDVNDALECENVAEQIRAAMKEGNDA